MLNVARVHRFQWSLVVAAACWGGATVISKRAVEEIEPLTLLPLELRVSVAVLASRWRCVVSGFAGRPRCAGSQRLVCSTPVWRTH